MLMRILAWAGGLVFSLGLASITLSLMGWLRQGRYYGAPFLGLAGLAVIAAIVIRMVVRSPAVRAGAMAAMWTSVLLLVSCAFMAGLIDTKQASMRGWLRAELHQIRRAQDAALRDSGRYTATPALDESHTFERRIGLTRDGWTAAVEYSGLPGTTCVIFIGSEPLAPAVNQGEAVCPRMPFSIVEHAPGIVMLLLGAGLVAMAGRLTPRPPLTVPT